MEIYQTRKQEEKISNQRAEKRHSENIKSEVNQMSGLRGERWKLKSFSGPSFCMHRSPGRKSFCSLPLLRMMYTQFVISNHKFLLPSAFHLGSLAKEKHFPFLSWNAFSVFSPSFFRKTVLMKNLGNDLNVRRETRPRNSIQPSASLLIDLCVKRKTFIRLKSRARQRNQKSGIKLIQIMHNLNVAK